MTLNKAKGFAFKSSAPLGLGPNQMSVQDQIAFAIWTDLHLGQGYGVPEWIAFGPETKSQKKPSWIWVGNEKLKKHENFTKCWNATYERNGHSDKFKKHLPDLLQQ